MRHGALAVADVESPGSKRTAGRAKMKPPCVAPVLKLETMMLGVRAFKGTYDARGNKQYKSFTCSTVLVPWSYEDGVLTGTVFVYFPPNEATGFPGWQGRIDYPWNQD